MIGLREFRKTYKGSSFTYKVKELWWQLRYAWQRAWRGYDYMDTFELCFRFRERMVPILKNFRENNVGLFYDSEKQRNLTEEETNSIINEMIYHFENSDTDAWTENTNLTPFNDGDSDKITEFEQNAIEHEKQALAMFVKWFDCLWY